MIDEIAELKNNNIECFRMIFARYHAKLYQYIYNRTQSSYLAQEVVQLTFIKLWENRDKLSEEFTIDIQLFRIAKTTLIDELRKETIKLKYNDLISNANDQIYEDNQVADKDTLRYVYAAMENLPAIRKKVFKLSRINGFSYKQIADLLSISPKTVENHIAKAIKQLRNSINSFFL
jgi:RNA polymerase sigma-70 factor (family 1)